MSAEVISLPPEHWSQMRRECLAAHRDRAFSLTADELAFVQRLGIDRPPGAAELQKKTFPPLKVLVDPLVTEGVTLFAGREKIGKSWLALDIALAIASGASAAGIWPTEQSDVLYLALEDGEKRLQRRLERLAGDEGWPSNLYLKTEAPRLGEGLADFLGAWGRTAEKPGLVIVDTLQLIRPVRTNQRYADDTADMKALKEIADKLDISIITIHHLRKAAADSDNFDLISGTTGLAAGADATAILKRHPSGQGFELYTRGRDVAEQDVAMMFDGDTCRWTASSRSADVVFRSDERGDILQALETLGEASPQELADLLGKSSTAIRQMLVRMKAKGEVVSPGYGRYSHPPSHQSQCHSVEGEQ